MVNFVVALECLVICLTLAALLLLIGGEGAREQKLLIFIMCGSLVQNAGYLLELTAPTLEAAMTAVTVENVGSAFVPLCYCWFTYSYCYTPPPKKLLYARYYPGFRQIHRGIRRRLKAGGSEQDPHRSDCPFLYSAGKGSY